MITKGGFGKQTPLKAYTPKGRARAALSTIDKNALAEIGKIAAAAWFK